MSEYNGNGTYINEEEDSVDAHNIMVLGHEVANWRPEGEHVDNPNELNRIHNAKNKFQMDNKKVLCCCSAGLLRSPTAAVVLSSKPYNYNTRACGLEPSYALVPWDRVLAYWADEIVVMTPRHMRDAKADLAEWKLERTVICLNIDDNYCYRQKELVDAIRTKYDAYLEENNLAI